MNFEGTQTQPITVSLYLGNLLYYECFPPITEAKFLDSLECDQLRQPSDTKNKGL